MCVTVPGKWPSLVGTSLVDLKLVAPRSGRVQYKISQAGEVVAAGTRIVTLLDLHDVYMTIYLPAAQTASPSLFRRTS